MMKWRMAVLTSVFITCVNGLWTRWQYVSSLCVCVSEWVVHAHCMQPCCQSCYKQVSRWVISEGAAEAARTKRLCVLLTSLWKSRTWYQGVSQSIKSTKSTLFNQYANLCPHVPSALRYVSKWNKVVHVCQAGNTFLQSGRDVELRALYDCECYLAGSSLCSLRISTATMYHTKTAETAVVTWTHFYCNSSIESKKVLININTMPMFRSPPRTVPTPFFPPQEKKREGNTWKKKATTRVFIYRRRIFLFAPRLSLIFFSFHLCTGHTSRENNAHTKDKLLHSWILFFETLSCKANH